jgi:hypothetical protein
LAERKINPPPPRSNLKGKKPKHFESMIGPSHWLDEIPFRKTVCHNFSLGLMRLAKNTPVISVRRGGFWGKHMGLKAGAIGNNLRIW